MAEAEDVSGIESRQGNGSSEVDSESSKEQNLSTQETLAAGKGPFEETGNDVSKAVQEVNTPRETQPGDMEDATEVMKDEEVLRQEVSGERSKQETGSLNVETGSSKEETLPRQLIMAVGKGALKETGEDEGTAILETDIPSKPHTTESYESYIKESSMHQSVKQQTGMAF